MKTHYEVIGVAPSATPDEIKRAFRRAISRYHPDKVQHLGSEFRDIAAVRAAELTNAYQILINPAARHEYDCGLNDGAAAPAAAAPRGAEEAATQAAAADRHGWIAPDAETFHETRVSLTEVVKRATLKRFGDAVNAVCVATTIQVAGFDAGYGCSATRGLFKKTESTLRLLVRLVPVVDPAALEESWPAVLKAGAADEPVCVMLMGQGIAPPKDLAAALTEHRRRAQNPGPPLIPVDFRDWDALFPPDTPALARAVVGHLRKQDR